MYPLLEIYLIDTWATVESLNILTLNQSEANLKAGTLTIGWDLDDVPDLGKDDAVAVRVKQDSGDTGTVIFSGKITDRTSNGTTVTYTASNVLNDLARIQYVLGGLTRFDLFRDATGAVLNIGEQIAAALDYAAAQGIDVDYDQDEIDDLDLDMPSTEVSDITVYEIIKKALAYRSDILVAVQYTAPGTDDIIRLVDKSDITAETLTIGTDIAAYTAKALYDRQIEGVVLTYKWPSETITDSYGVTAGANVLRQHLEMTAPAAAEFTALKMHTDAVIDQSQWFFWCLANKLAGGYSGELTHDTEYGYPDLVDNPQYNNLGGTHIILMETYNGLDSLIKEALGPVWDANCSVDRVYFRRLYSGTTYWEGKLTSAEPESGNWWPYYAFTPPSWASVTSADGVDVTYDVSMTVVADPDPTGLAEQLYNILSPLQYDGQIVCYDDLTTPNRICSILRKLNIAGAEDDLETMAAIVQQCRCDLLSGTRTDKFGVASHLEPQDFITLCRANKSIGNLRIA